MIRQDVDALLSERQALTALGTASSALTEARLVLFGEDTYELATHVRAELAV